MNRSHIIRRIALTVAVGAFAVALSTPAQADPPTLGVRPDDRAVRGPGSVATRVSGDLVRPDDRADRSVAPDDRADRRLPDRRLPIVSVEGRSATASEFDWIDAGIGAVGAFVLALLVVSASVIRLRHRRAAAPS
jgi:hypothetical protein